MSVVARLNASLSRLIHCFHKVSVTMRMSPCTCVYSDVYVVPQWIENCFRKFDDYPIQWTQQRLSNMFFVLSSLLKSTALTHTATYSYSPCFIAIPSPHSVLAMQYEGYCTTHYVLSSNEPCSLVRLCVCCVYQCFLQLINLFDVCFCLMWFNGFMFMLTLCSVLVRLVGYECSTVVLSHWIWRCCHAVAVSHGCATGNHGDTEAVHLEVQTLYGVQSQVCEWMSVWPLTFGPWPLTSI